MYRQDNKEPFHYPISDELDLHTFQPRELKSVVEEYIAECIRSGIFRVRIIHGKGKSIQKHTVHSLLRKHPLVEKYYDAPSRSGGWGATIAHLKQPP